MSEQQTIIIFRTQRGKEPFTDWLESLRDTKGRQRIIKRLFRVEQGNFGDFKGVGDGIFELRFSFGPGYRVYFGRDGNTVIVLLAGGDKSSQEKDIQVAKIYWQEYLENND